MYVYQSVDALLVLSNGKDGNQHCQQGALMCLVWFWGCKASALHRAHPQTLQVVSLQTQVHESSDFIVCSVLSKFSIIIKYDFSLQIF